jgi:4-alpha-glucanotransferase
VDREKFSQFLFFRQWGALKAHCREHGVRVIGDVPIFVAHDSADVWAHPEHFKLDALGAPTFVAGVPPDYFSATGQRWGNPVYDWPRLAADGFRWWVARVRTLLATVDLVRLDHFRGFAAYWEIPAAEPTAVSGRWVPAPGRELFAALKARLGELPILAEDLGVITPDVEALRDEEGFPGMRVLQFAFAEDSRNKYLPHNYVPHVVAYTGTHDNDTTLGWFRSREVEGAHREREFAARYLNVRDPEDVSWDAIRAAFASVADTVIVPLQDVLALGTEARMNRPGNGQGSWTWRYRAGALTETVRGRLKQMTETYGRHP